MYIQPSSNLKLYSGVPLDNTYEHTLYFKDRQEQNNYFHGGSGANVVKNFTNLTYVRVNKGSVKVEAKTSEVYNANYMAFKNEQFENKWFYAFIIKIDYLNNETCEIFYEIDEMQTWFLDCTLLDSYIEREHTTSDRIGEHLVTEPIGKGLMEESSYYYSDDHTSVESERNIFTNWGAVLTSPYNNFGNDDSKHLGRIFGSMPTCLYTIGFKDIGGHSYIYHIQDFFNVLNNDWDASIKNIINLSIYPTDLIPDSAAYQRISTSERGGNFNELNSVYSTSVEFKKPVSNGRYIPRNKKLLTYPYCYFVLNYNGNEREYKYELFSDSKCEFLAIGDPTTGSSVALFPQGYASSGGVAYDEVFYLDNLPKIAFASDKFSDWVYNNASNVIGGVLTNTANVLGKTNKAEQGLKLGGSITESLISGFSASAQTNEIFNGVSSALSRITNMCGGTFIPKSLKLEYAEMLDDFFDKYGYAINKIKRPNINARKHWTYTKTNGCVLKGNAPVDSINSIIKCFDRGITFWKNADEVGKYTEYANDNIPL